jgi:hypothetical protein
MAPDWQTNMQKRSATTRLIALGLIALGLISVSFASQQTSTGKQQLDEAVQVNSNADSVTFPTLDNVPYGMSGSWYDPETSGQGFDLQFYPDTDLSKAALLYWYTFDPAGTHKVWFLALGPIAGSVAHLQIAEASQYQPFNQPPAPGTINEAVGKMEFELLDCSHAHVSWHFDRPLSNGLSASNDGAQDLQRLTPGLSILGQDLCSTPLSTFAPADSDSQCTANYNTLFVEFQNLTSEYNQCVTTNVSDESTIDALESELSSLQADIDGAYNDGYDAGASDGYNGGYGDGYSDGYDEGQSGGYDKGYSAGYDDGYADGSSSTESSTTAKSPAVLRNVQSLPGTDTHKVKVNNPGIRHAPSVASAGANATIQKMLRQLEEMKMRHSPRGSRSN